MSNAFWNSLNGTLTGVLEMTWPMILISVVLLSSLRLSYLLKSKEEFVLHKEILSLFFIVYILCLFQVVTFQDISNIGTNNFIPFREILRYDFGSRLFIKNIIGNVIMFVPYGFFVEYYCKSDKLKSVLWLVFIASLVIETTQLAIGRVFDVDDVLLNVIGGVLGYYIYRIINKLGDAWPKVFKSSLFLDLITIVIFALFAFCILGR
ncbi:MAG: VanZ family protein [bacterium]|nr:VanZ family protein [bacterium]